MKYVVRVAVALVVLVGVYLAGRQNSGADSTTTTSTTVASAPASTAAFYLDVGASASLGFQPTGVPDHNGARTNTGYANDLVFREALRGVTLTLVQVGCPGETVESMLSTTIADHCYQLPMTQLRRAEQILRADKGQTGLVTIDLGFNDVRVCLDHLPVNTVCVAGALARVAADLPIIVRDLKASAGPHVRFVGLLYNDPYLGYFLDGPAGPAAASYTLASMNQLNAIMTHVYQSEGVAVANVPVLFQTDVTTRVALDNVGVIPENVAAACADTWFCYKTPFGPDDHPNDAGYSLIAQAIEDVVPARW